MAGPDRFGYHAIRFTHYSGDAMKIAVAVFAAVGVAAAGAVSADAGEDLLKKNGCTACHAIDKKLIGPAYVDVAAKYKGDAGAAAKLAEKVKKGGSGVWGQVPMPPNPQVSDADLKAMIAYILALKK
jgi:cytochrome c